MVPYQCCGWLSCKCRLAATEEDHAPASDNCPNTLPNHLHLIYYSTSDCSAYRVPSPWLSRAQQLFPAESRERWYATRQGTTSEIDIELSLSRLRYELQAITMFESLHLLQVCGALGCRDTLAR